MQTRKRAKPVKFGKKTPEKKEKEEPKAKKPEIEKITEKKEEKASVDIAKPKDTALAQPHEAEGVISNAIHTAEAQMRDRRIGNFKLNTAIAIHFFNRL